MSAQLIPDIGSKGKFTFKDPVSKKISNTTSLTCQSIRTLAELISQKENTFKDVYLALGLTKADYENDISAGVSILSLQAETGSWFYVPSSYLSSYPNINGVTYTRMMMGVGLGAVADTLDLEGLKVSISNIVYDQLGISPEIKLISVSQSAIISYGDHDKIEAVRKAKVKLNKSDSRLLTEAVDARDAAEKRVKYLEDFIKMNRSKLM